MGLGQQERKGEVWLLHQKKQDEEYQEREEEADEEDESKQTNNLHIDISVDNIFSIRPGNIAKQINRIPESYPFVYYCSRRDTLFNERQDVKTKI